MNPELIAACQMFLIPTSILLVALAVTTKEELKSVLSVLGLGISILWVTRVGTWKNLSIGDRYTALGLALIFFVATLVSVFVHIRAWRRENEGPQQQKADV
jgi:hypothetical protein